MLLTIERPDVTQEPGDHHVSVIKCDHDHVRVPEPGWEREELQHCVWRGPEQAPVPWGIQLRIRGEAMSRQVLRYSHYLNIAAAAAGRGGGGAQTGAPAGGQTGQHCRGGEEAPGEH